MFAIVIFSSRLVITHTNRHTEAYIEHYSGKTVITASTREWAIRQFLKSNVDTAASQFIGKILAQRCLEFGLLEVHSKYEEDGLSQKIKSILEGLKTAGISLKEPERYLAQQHWMREPMEKSWEVTE